MHFARCHEISCFFLLTASLSELTEFVGTGAGALTGSLAGSGLTCAGLFGAVFPNLVAGRR